MNEKAKIRMVKKDISKLQDRLKGLTVMQNVIIDTLSCYDVMKITKLDSLTLSNKISRQIEELEEVLHYYQDDLEALQTRENKVKKLLSAHRFTELEKIKIREQLTDVTLNRDCRLLVNKENDIYLDNHDYSVFLCNKEG